MQNNEQSNPNRSTTHRNALSTASYHLKRYLFYRSQVMTSSSSITVTFAAVIITICQLQKWALLTQIDLNPTLGRSPQMPYVSQYAGYLFLRVPPAVMSLDLKMGVLMGFQLLPLIAYALPITHPFVNNIMSQFAVHIPVRITTMPALFLASTNIISSTQLPFSFALLFICLINNIIYLSMHFQTSIQRQPSNSLIRKPSQLTNQIIILILLSLFPFTSMFFPQMSFTIYVIVTLVLLLSKIRKLCLQFIYFNESITRVYGVLITFQGATAAIYLLNNVFPLDMAVSNVLVFIFMLSIFACKFFLVFRQFIVKGTIIDKKLDTQNQTTIYIMWYLHCFKNINEKKNQLYISSLLKNHSNECMDGDCCCKHRSSLYDPTKRVFGNPSFQPHRDFVFTKHYYLKLLINGVQQFHKSITLMFLLSLYYLQILQFIPQTMQLIRKLNKLLQKKALSFSQQYILYCLEKRCYRRITAINLKRGNINLEDIKKFDQKMIDLKESIKVSVSMYHSLWRNLYISSMSSIYAQVDFDEKLLTTTCKKTLQLMFKIQKCYSEIRAINCQSDQLKSLMLLYSKMVVHDIHLLSEIKKEISGNQERNLLFPSSTQMPSIQLFGQKTSTIITIEINRVKWASKNAASMFAYEDSQFIGMDIKKLMPKYFAQNHDAYVQKWKKSGLSQKLNKTRYLWGNTKNGVCFSLLIYMKIVPLPAEQNFAIFSLIEKLDDENQIICGKYGDIIGSGKRFFKTLSISPFLFQQNNINIQIFIPYLFEYFFDQFYPEFERGRQIKFNSEIRREGYFPANLAQVIKQVCDDRNKFIKNKSAPYSAQTLQLYSRHLKAKMQELTCYLNGEYISLALTAHQVHVWSQAPKSVMVFKICYVKRDNVEKYYHELQRMIGKLQGMNAVLKEKKKKQQKAMKKQGKNNDKFDFFRVFLNPKKVKQILQNQQTQSLPSMNDEKPVAVKKKQSGSGSNMQHRKNLAMYSKYEIKNERVKYNLWKIKKLLFDEGVISRYTYNMMLGKNSQNVSQFDSMHELLDEKQVHRSGSTKKSLYEQGLSEDEMISTQGQSPLADKENDHETFNSGSSSATFISMTNSIKQFKIKLRSLNTPMQLWVLNVGIIIGVIIIVGGLSVCTFKGKGWMDAGIDGFQIKKEAGLIMDSILMGKTIELSNRNGITVGDNNNITTQAYSYYLSLMYSLLQSHLRITPSLPYLSLPIDSGELLRQFYIQQFDLMKNHIYKPADGSFQSAVEVLAGCAEDNSVYEGVWDLLLVISLLTLSLLVVLASVTVPVVCNVENKANEIHELLAKISPKDRDMYFKHFKLLDKQLSQSTSPDINNLNTIISQIDRPKGVPGESKIINFISKEFVVGEVNQNKPNSSSTNPNTSNNEEQAKLNCGLYIKILLSYGMMIISMAVYLAYLQLGLSVFLEANRVYNLMITDKTRSSLRVMAYTQSAYNTSLHIIPYTDNDLALVQDIFDAGQLSTSSDKFSHWLNQFTTNSICDGLSLSNTSQHVCQSLHGGILTKGIIDNLYLTQYTINLGLGTNNNSSILQLSAGYYYSSLAIYSLFEMITVELNKQTKDWILMSYVSVGIALGVLLAFGVVWAIIYLKLAERASYINAFLLLVPFDVLSQNPYIKLYIKKQFNLKSANY